MWPLTPSALVMWGWRLKCLQEPGRWLREPCETAGDQAIGRDGVCGELGRAHLPKGLHVAAQHCAG